MCGRFNLKTSSAQLAAQFHLPSVGPLEPRYNIAPTQSIAVVREVAGVPPGGAPGRELVWLHWGLIPRWAKDAKIASQTINARAETAAEKPAFRAAWSARRCVIPADGFYEWRRVGKAKQPYAISRADGKLLAFAGLWERWSGAEEPIESCTILTVPANATLRELHERMPAMLGDDAQIDEWLSTAPRSNDELSALLRPVPADFLLKYPVSRMVNNPRHDAPDCLDRVAPADAEEASQRLASDKPTARRQAKRAGSKDDPRQQWLL